MLKQVLDSRQDLQQFLFIRGLLLTNNDIDEKKNARAFYSNCDIETSQQELI